jgi:hypothetical protein
LGFCKSLYLENLVGGLSEAFKVKILAITSKTGLRGICVLALRRRDLDNLLAVKNVGVSAFIE